MSHTKWTAAGKGLAVWEGEPVEGRVVEVKTVEDVLSLMDDTPDDMIVLTYSASATILSPLYDVARGIICTAGTVGSHVAIISREYGLPCIVGAALEQRSLVGARVRLEPRGEIFVDATSSDRAAVPDGTSAPSQYVSGLDQHEFSILHFIRLKGIMAVDVFPEVATPREISDLIEKGVLRNSKRGVMLTEAGLQLHRQWLERQRQTVDLEVIATSYDRFLGVNQPVKDACAKWQNSKGDEEDLFAAVEALVAYLDRVRPALRRAGEAGGHFHSYVTRLESALEKVQAGDVNYLTAPSVDSFHNIWFECHEDYLMILGRDREAEERV